MAVAGSALALVASSLQPAAARTAASSAAGTAAASPAAVSSAPDALAAMAAAHRQGSRVEILSDRTPFAQTFANPDGTSTFTESPAPQRVLQGSSWTAPDASLTQNSDGSWSPAAALGGLSLSGGGGTVLATVHSGKYQMSLSWPSALPAPVVSGAAATYPEVFPGVDLVVTANTSGGFDEALVIKDQAAAADPQLAGFTLGIALSGGLSQHPAADGSVQVQTADGAVVFSSPAPQAWDSSAAGAGVAGPGTGGLLMAVPASYSASGVQLAVPPGYTSGAVFPVYVDPSYSISPSWGNYGEIQSANKAANELANTPDGNVQDGWDGTGADRGYYIYGMPSSIQGPTTYVLSATLNDTAVKTLTATSTSHTVNLWWTAQYTSTSSWNNQPAKLSTSGVGATFTTASTAPNKAVSWNVASFLQSDLQAGNFQFTAELFNADETHTANYVEFAAYPTLTITYDHAPLAPSSTSVSPSNNASDGHLYTSSAQPSFTATATDSDGDPVAYHVQILSGQTVVASGTTSPSVPSGTAASWQVPNALTNGSTYTYQVQATDGTESGAWSTAQSFTVQTDTPAAPVVTCTNYPSGTWTAQASGSTTCSWNAPLSHMNGYSWELDGAWSWTTGTSVTINPGPGMHLLSVVPQSAAGVWGAHGDYNFAVGANGAMLAPAAGSQTSSIVFLQAAAPPGYTSASFSYREGTTGSFAQIPTNSGGTGATVYSCGCAVSWPVSTSTNADGVQTALLDWYVTRVVTDDGPIQVEATFTNANNGTITTPPVTVTLDRVGTGADYGVTQAGPVTVGLQSGNAALSATDVNIAAYGTAMAVTRTFNSVQPGIASIFGKGWTSSLTGGITTPWTNLTVGSNGYAVLRDAGGNSYDFAPGTTTGGITPWTLQGGNLTTGLTLTQSTSTGLFTLNASGTVTVFAQAGSAGTYLPQTVAVPGDPSSAAITYDGTSTDGTYGDPQLMTAPVASGQPSITACRFDLSTYQSQSQSQNQTAYPSWAAGCRGLELVYNSGNDVAKVNFVYTDNSGAFHRVQVAAYSYDAAGELTSEWDPRLSTPLVTGYAYDETSGTPDYQRITQVTPAQAAGSGALAPWTLTYDDTQTDATYGNLLTVSRTHNTANGGTTATSTIGYSVPLTTAAGGPLNMDAATVAGWGQSDAPTSAVAIFPPTRVPASPPTATDYQYAQIDYYDANGRMVNTASYVSGAWAVTTTQYDAYGNVTSTLSAANRAYALTQSNPAGTAWQLSAVSVYGCDNFGATGPCTSSDQQYEVLTDSYGPAHQASVDGTVDLIRTHTAYTYDVGAPNGDSDSSGSPFMLVTSQTVSASIGDGIPGTATADARTTNSTYANASTNIGWTIGQPLTTVTDPGGLNIVKTSVFNTSSLYGGANLQTGSYMPSDTSGGGAGDTETVYYTAGTNPVAACQNKPEWANRVCQTGPAAQPGTSGLPNLPVTTYIYDDYLNPVTKTETFGSTGTRVTTVGYDAAERPATRTVAVTGTGMGGAVPETQILYSASSGLPTDTQTLNSGGSVTADINTTYDDFGQMLTYTDASGNATSYTYDISGRLTSRNDGEGTETITYTGSFGAPTQIADSQAGAFSATYNADGNLAAETYPGSLTATYTYDASGTATSLSYNGQAWTAPLTDTIVPNAVGDWATQSITDTTAPLVSSQAYSYDNADRLTTVNDSYGQCRAYHYDADANRTSLTTYGLNTDGSCQSSGGTTVTTSYDSADRDTNVGYAYDTQGDITTTPSADVGGAGDVTATYYANNMLASQTQSGTTTSWALDPTLGRFASYTKAGVTYTDHYSDSGNNSAWVSASGGGWTRSVTDFRGLLAAQVTASGTTLELPDLHGDIMATASPSAGATGPATTTVYNEFGVVESGSPGSYGWEGGNQISSNALGGELLMGARAYNPGTGRFSQTDPIPGGSANAYDYSAQNPVTNSDLAGTSNRSGGGCSNKFVGTSAAGTEFKTCTMYWNESYTAGFIDYLWAVSGNAFFCAAVFTVAFPVGGEVVAAVCTLVGATAGAVAGDLGYIDNLGGHVGIYWRIWLERAWWWWLGTHWSPWWTDGGYVWHQ
jgi:RHS repeat-associated protein